MAESVISLASDHEEAVQRFAKHLGANKIRRKIFEEIYGRVSKPRSKKQIMQATRIQSADEQQAQNALDHLWKHGLIVRIDNDGAVGDGSRFLYKKDLNVRAVRAEIIKYANNPKAAARLATKRTPIIRSLSFGTIAVKKALKKKKRLSVLYLTSNAEKSNALRVEAEVRNVQEAVRGSAFRDNVTLQYKPAADLNSLLDGINDQRPQIIHFSGHGNTGGIATDNGKVSKPASKFVTFDLLAKALAATDYPPDVIVLNSCKSYGARKSFLPPGKVAIVMRESVSDLAAAAFATKFYAAVAGGQSIRAAFAQGKVAVEAVSINEADTPELIAASGVDPSKIVLT